MHSVDARPLVGISKECSNVVSVRGVVKLDDTPYVCVVREFDDGVVLVRGTPVPVDIS